MTTPTVVPDMGDWISVAPLRDRAVSLLLVMTTGVATAHDLTGKRVLVSDPGDLYILWTGKYRTDVRRVTEADRQGLADALA